MLLRQGPVRRTLGPAGVARNESHFLAHQRRIFRRDVLAQARAHHLQDQRIAGIGDDRLRAAMRKQAGDRGADLVLNLLWQAGVGIRDQADVARRLVRRLQPALVTCHVRQHHQEAADVALGNGRGQVKFSVRGFDVHVRRSRYASGGSRSPPYASQVEPAMKPASTGRLMPTRRNTTNRS
jgi:hypothetical protein